MLVGMDINDSYDVVIPLNGQLAPQREDAEKLAARGIGVVPGEIARVAVAEHRKEVAS